MTLGASACGTDDPCEDGSCADASVEDAPAPDVHDGGLDAGPDLGFLDAYEAPDIGEVLNTVGCTPCGANGFCGDGLCVGAGNESYCTDRCDTALDSCSAGFTCFDIDNTPNGMIYSCIPPNARCSFAATGFGTYCYEDASKCMVGLDRCQGDRFGLGYCTRTCASPSECPPGYVCGTGDRDLAQESVCLADIAPDGQRCGRESLNDERLCRENADCDAGRVA